MASTLSVNPVTGRKVVSSPRITGSSSILHGRAGRSQRVALSATLPEKLQQGKDEAVIITKLELKKPPATLVERKSSTPSSDEKNSPVVAESTGSARSYGPVLPGNFNRLTPKARLKAVKQYLSAFTYKQTPATHFNTHKLRPLTRIMDTARMIIFSPQPIKCVEAVFLALYLTAGIPDCDRIPLGFKTSLDEQVYQHIVLLVQHGGKFGAFGISRQPDLMNKDLMYDSLSDIVENFKKAYESSGHTILKIRLGLPVEHKVDSPNYVCWRHLSLSPNLQTWEECRVAMENHSLKRNRLWDLWLLAGKGADPKKKTLLKAPGSVKEGILKTKGQAKDLSMKGLAETEQKHATSLGSASMSSSLATERIRSTSTGVKKSKWPQNKSSFLIKRSTSNLVRQKVHSQRRNVLLAAQRRKISRVLQGVDHRKRYTRDKTPNIERSDVGGRRLKEHNRR